MICTNCGVEIDEMSEHCPLCGNAMPVLSGTDPGATHAADAPAGDQPLPPEIVSGVKKWLWEVVSVLAFTAAIVVFAADFAYGSEVSWSRYPLLAILFFWLSATSLILLSRFPVLVFLCQSVFVAGLLYMLGRFLGATHWFLPLALPVTVLVAAVSGSVIAIATRLKLTLILTIAVILLGIGVFLLALEVILNNFQGNDVVVSWSLVAFACLVALFVVLLFVEKRLRERHSEYRKIFHL